MIAGLLSIEALLVIAVLIYVYISEQNQLERTHTEFEILRNEKRVLKEKADGYEKKYDELMEEKQALIEDFALLEKELEVQKTIKTKEPSKAKKTTKTTKTTTKKTTKK